jgi:DNA end-binding protein Ku
MAQSVWKGYISFGLVSVPIRLMAAARAEHVRFHELHRTCGTRLKQQMYCPRDEVAVPRDEIILGYEVANDQYVTVDREELRRFAPRTSRAMDILQFVKLEEVDPIYFETSYYLMPEEPGRRAYALLLDTMERLKLAAVAKVTLHQRERPVILRPFENGLTLHTIYYAEEIRPAAEYGKNLPRDLKKEEAALAEQFAKSLTKPFHPEEFHNEYQRQIQKLLETKMKGKPLPAPEKPPKLAPVIDLMDALKKSMAGRGASAQRAGASAHPARTKHRKLRKTA